MIKMTEERLLKIAKNVEGYDKGNLSQVNHILRDMTPQVELISKLHKDLKKDFEKGSSSGKFDETIPKEHLRTFKLIQEQSDKVSKYMKDAIKNLK